MERHITAPFSRETAASLKAGDYVYITGTIYTARDAAHKRMQEALDAGQPLPLDLAGNVIYYMGPSPAREGRPIGSAGPTTASRMDKYAPKIWCYVGWNLRCLHHFYGIIRQGEPEDRRYTVSPM